MTQLAQLWAARQYAARVRLRNAVLQPPCTCAACQQSVMLPAVLRLVAAEARRQKNQRRRAQPATAK